MPGLLRRSMVYLGLAEEREGDFDDYDDYAAVPQRSRERAEVRVGADRSAPEPGALRRFDAEPARTGSGRRGEHLRVPVGAHTSMPTTGSLAVAHHRDEEESMQTDVASYRIHTLHPHSYNEAREIGEQFRNGVPVIMNLTDMDDVDAKRLVDFAAGLIFGLRGSIERVTNKVFLLSPSNVEVSAEDKAAIREAGFFNQS